MLNRVARQSVSVGYRAMCPLCLRSGCGCAGWIAHRECVRDVDLPAAIGLPPEHVDPVLWKFLEELAQSILNRQRPYEADRCEIAVDENLPDSRVPRSYTSSQDR